MAKFEKTKGLELPDEDCIVIHLGHLSEERYNNVSKAIIAFMNARWPNPKNVGIDN